MPLTLPIDALANMQVSFKVDLADGGFAFDMLPLRAQATDIDTAGLPCGMKLHLRATSDSCGVTLILDQTEFYPSEFPAAEEPLSGVASESGSGALESQPCSFDFFASVSRYCSPSTFGTPDPLSLRMPQHCQASFNDYFDTLNVERADETNFKSDFPSYTEAAVNDIWENDSQDNKNMDVTPSFEANIEIPLGQIISDTPSIDVPSRTASACSKLSDSPPPQAVGGLRCPDPSCTRSFKSKYTLSKHTKAHEPKSSSLFRCTMGCVMQFSRKHDRLRHEVNRHGRVCDWECKLCLGFFSSETSLKKHRCKKSGVARWICEN
ncbi:hypothetical protein C8R46DRAFT_1274579 [Mycena filopes]|nr:hypothetical protein C8R46DRAFT_1274579 [Mycena filopes]